MAISTYLLYTIHMLGQMPHDVYKNYFGVLEFAKKFPDEKACEQRLIELKYPDGFKCQRCGHSKYYRLRGDMFKRSRLLQCVQCKSQISLTANTMFSGTKLPLLKWFWALFFITQTKKGISGWLLSKQIGVCESTARLMLNKLRAEMQEDAIDYQIGGPGRIVELDEFEIGGVGSEKQNVLILLEKNAQGYLGRVRFAPMTDETAKSLELNAIPQIAAGSVLHSDGKKTYRKIANRYFNRVSLNQVAHWEEQNSHRFLADLNTIVGNLKTWYRGIYHQFALRNSAYYLNEFAYRFNRRRSERNIFDRLLKRSISRPRNLKSAEFFAEEIYLPLAS